MSTEPYTVSVHGTDSAGAVALVSMVSFNVSMLPRVTLASLMNTPGADKGTEDVDSPDNAESPTNAGNANDFENVAAASSTGCVGLAQSMYFLCRSGVCPCAFLHVR